MLYEPVSSCPIPCRTVVELERSVCDDYNGRLRSYLPNLTMAAPGDISYTRVEITPFPEDIGKYAITVHDKQNHCTMMVGYVNPDERLWTDSSLYPPSMKS